MKNFPYQQPLTDRENFCSGACFRLRNGVATARPWKISSGGKRTRGVNKSNAGKNSTRLGGKKGGPLGWRGFVPYHLPIVFLHGILIMVFSSRNSSYGFPIAFSNRTSKWYFQLWFASVIFQWYFPTSFSDGSFRWHLQMAFPNGIFRFHFAVGSYNVIF